jgi:hypothetical protein
MCLGDTQYSYLYFTISECCAASQRLITGNGWADCEFRQPSSRAMGTIKGPISLSSPGIFPQYLSVMKEGLPWVGMRLCVCMCMCFAGFTATVATFTM